MAALIGLIVGALLGGATFGSPGAAIGGFAGFFVGAVIASRRERDVQRRAGPTVVIARASAPAGDDALAHKVAALERRVGELERALRAGGEAVASATADAMPGPVTVSGAPRVEAIESSSPQMLPPSHPLPPVSALASDDAFVRAPGGTAPPLSLEADAAPGGAAAAAANGTATLDAYDGGGGSAAPVPPNPLWAWMVGGNTLARIGVLLLFIGVGFLLKYAVEHVYVPISVRLAGVALGGVALLVLGWRLRRARRAYAMVLQGGGVGVLYLTVFAALHLYALVSPVAAFLLLLWISALSSWLAVRQDAISLAALAVVGGFLAPILTSSQTGNHVLLFSYYALLNVGILGHRMVQGVASAQPAGVRVHVPRWGVLGSNPLSARKFRDHRAVSRPVLPLLCRTRRPLCASPIRRSAPLRRRGPRVRHAARRRGAAERARQ